MNIKQPMLAVATIPCLETEVKYPCYIQPKLDGIRCVAINGVAYSRKMKPIPNKFIQKFFAEHNLHGLDGELMVMGDFNNVQSAVMSEEGEPDFYYAVYDYWDSDLPYNERVKLYTDIVRSVDIDFHLRSVHPVVVENAEQAAKSVEQYVDLGYEGGMLRSMSGKYKQGRSTVKEGYLLKLKSFMDDEAIVIGFEEKMTNNNQQERDERGYAKRSSKKDGLVGANTLGSLQVDWNGVVFNIGSGFNDTQRKEIWDNQERYLGKLVTFKYQEVIKATGRPRFATFKWWREEYNQ